jgi:Short C-terminal domain
MDGESAADRDPAGLVEYAVVVLPDAEAIPVVLGELVRLARAGTIALIDAVVVASDASATISADELAPSVLEAAGVAPPLRPLLSWRDLELIGEAVPPGHLGLVAVLEDRWAASLAATAGLAGGQLVAGERVPAGWLAAGLTDAGSAAPAASLAAAERRTHDVLVRRPWVDDPVARWRPPVVDVVDELEELAMLYRRGLLSRQEFERQKQRVLDE